MKKIIMILCCVVFTPAVADAACAVPIATIAATAPAANFTDNGDGTVTDNTTGLMWKQCTEGQTWSATPACTGTATPYTWQAALQAAEALNNGGGFAGFTNWRMPNIKELGSIVEHQCATPSIDTAIFPGTVAGMYWSSTAWPANALNVVGMNFNDSNDAVNAKTTGTLYLRMVR